MDNNDFNELKIDSTSFEDVTKLATAINNKSCQKNINLKKYHKDTTNIVVARLIASDIIIQRKESVGSVHILMVQCLAIPIP